MDVQREKVEIPEEAQKIFSRTPNRDRYDDVLRRTAKELNINIKNAQILVDQQDSRAIKIWNKMVSEETDRVYKQATEIVRKRKKMH